MFYELLSLTEKQIISGYGNKILQLISEMNISRLGKTLLLKTCTPAPTSLMTGMPALLANMPAAFTSQPASRLIRTFPPDRNIS